jgi:hypothetical protein
MLLSRLAVCLFAMLADNVRHPAGSTFSDYGDMNVHGRTTSADRRHTNNRLKGIPRADLYDEGTTSGLSEEEMISAAIAQSLQAPTPYLAPGVMPRSTPALMPRIQSNGPPVSALYATASTANSMKTPEYHIHGIEAAAIALKSDETPSFIANTRKHLIDSRRKNRANMSDVDKRKHAKVIDGLSKPYNSTLINVLKSVKEEPTPDKAEELLIMAEDLESIVHKFRYQYIYPQ